MRVWRSASPEETSRIGAALARELLPDGALLLRGDLGTGKTVVARGVAAGLGVDPEEVQSPTFTIVREHTGESGRFLHLDLYRLEPREVTGAGVEEMLEEPGVKVVEWAERLTFVPPFALQLVIVDMGSGRRELREVQSPEGAAPR